jgi:elongation factor P
METNDLYKGVILNYNNEPHVLVDKEFYKPGKGSSFTKVRLQNIRTGKLINDVFKSGAKIETLEVETKSMQYMYQDGSMAYFMNPKTFDQIQIELDSIPNKTDYLHEKGNYIMTFYEGSVIYVQIPVKLGLLVTETPDAVKGDTATNAYKEAILETGAKVMVPLFIKNGDRIIINTETNTYYSKE